MMIYKNLDKIDENDLEALIDNGVAEGKTIEYKQELLISQDQDKKEFLYDVSSFANTQDGDLIFGIIEDKVTGLPQRVEGIDIDNADELIRKIENLIRDGIEPRLPGVQSATISLSNGKAVLILRIQRSWNTPHQVTFKGADKFYARATNGKYKLDVAQIRNAVLLSDTLTERIRQFRLDRIATIRANDIPVPLQEYGKIGLHFIPFNSFEPGRNYDLARIARDFTSLRPLGVGSSDHRFTFEGILNYHLESNKKSKGYVQLFRNGILETVNSSILTPYDSRLEIPSLPTENYEVKILETVESYLTFIRQQGIGMPLVIALSLINVKGYYMESKEIHRRGEPPILIDRDVLLLPEIFIENIQDDLPTLMQPVFDQIWNACGIEKSRNYDESGKWRYK